MADIPPETEAERRDRERFERELKERERREGRGRGGGRGPPGPQPPPGLLGSWEFKEDAMPPIRKWAGQEDEGRHSQERRGEGRHSQERRGEERRGEGRRQERGGEGRRSQQRTPSLSPEPGTEQHRDYVRREEVKLRREEEEGYRAGVPKFRDEREERPREATGPGCQSS